MAKYYNNNVVVDFPYKPQSMDFETLERKYDFKFPKAIRAHYEYFNGGEPDRYLYYDDEGYEYILQQIIPMAGPTRVLDTVLNGLRYSGLLPSNLIPFADDPSGDLFCFDVNPGSEGHIYLWYHDTVDDAESFRYVCDSIDVFINGMVADV